MQPTFGAAAFAGVLDHGWLHGSLDGVAMAFAQAAPAAAAGGETNLVKNVLLPVALGIIMFGMGLALTREDFARVVRSPRAVVVGLALQMLGLPLLGLAVVWAFGLTEYWAVGLLLLAVCPGGTTSNFIAHLSRGDTALSITLTAVNSLLTVFTIPLLVGLSLAWFVGEARPVEVNAAEMMGQIFAVTVVPVALGMAVRARSLATAVRLERPVRALSAVLFVLIVAGAVLKEKEKVATGFATVGVACVVLNVAAMALGFGVAKLLRFDHRQAITMGIEVGIQNATLAIVLATSSLDVDLLSFPAAVYGLSMFATAAVYGWVVNRGRPAVVPAAAGPSPP